MAKRLKAMGSPKYQKDGDPRTSGPGFGVSVHADTLLDPILKWRGGQMAFLDSMADVFHVKVPVEFLGRVFATMALTPQHTYQVLTKRPKRTRELLSDGRIRSAMGRALSALSEGPDLPAWASDMLEPRASVCPWPLPNVWLGSSIESDDYCWRADELRQVPAAVRFLSLEPLLGPLPSLDLTGIDWVIVGGESGPGARPMSPGWARALRDQCVAEGVAFHFKQFGEWGPAGMSDRFADRQVVDGVEVRRYGKKSAGRILDGQTWDELPQPQANRIGV